MDFNYELVSQLLKQAEECEKKIAAVAEEFCASTTEEIQEAA